jgi:hypothetical protein
MRLKMQIGNKVRTTRTLDGVPEDAVPAGSEGIIVKSFGKANSGSFVVRLLDLEYGLEMDYAVYEDQIALVGNSN